MQNRCLLFSSSPKGSVQKVYLGTFCHVSRVPRDIDPKAISEEKREKQNRGKSSFQNGGDLGDKGRSTLAALFFPAVDQFGWQLMPKFRRDFFLPWESYEVELDGEALWVGNAISLNLLSERYKRKVAEISPHICFFRVWSSESCKLWQLLLSGAIFHQADWPFHNSCSTCFRVPYAFLISNEFCFY